MKNFIWIPLCFLTVINTCSSTCQCGRTLVSTRIIGGTAAKIGSYPWMAAVKTFKIYASGKITIENCGGSIINNEWVLTAAHCLADGSDTEDDEKFVRVTYVGIGENDIANFTTKNLVYRRDNRIYEKIRVQNIIRADKTVVHEKYDSENIINDIALIHLNRKINFTDTIAPVCLETQMAFYPNLEVSGWGNVATGVKGDSNLMYVKVNEIAESVCSQSFSIDTNSQVCYKAGVKGTCQGDSGGPVVTRRQGRYYQVGVVSFGGARCETTPNVGTRVSRYYNWIKARANSGTWCTA